MPDFRRAKAGDDLVIPADTWNACLDAATAYRSSGGNRTSVPPVEGGTPVKVRVQNGTGDVVPRWSALHLTGPLVQPSDQEDEFENNIYISSATPDTPGQIWGVTQEPLAADAIGKVVVLGVSVAKIKVNDGTHLYADVTSDGGLTIQSAPSGAAKILWVGGDEDDDGNKWSLLLLGAGTIPAPTQRYQVYTPIDDTLVPIWTTARFQ